MDTETVVGWENAHIASDCGVHRSRAGDPGRARFTSTRGLDALVETCPQLGRNMPGCSVSISGTGTSPEVNSPAVAPPRHFSTARLTVDAEGLAAGCTSCARDLALLNGSRSMGSANSDPCRGAHDSCTVGGVDHVPAIRGQESRTERYAQLSIALLGRLGVPVCRV